jgi:HAD superfamily hydrolase (TIGR01459 family)
MRHLAGLAELAWQYDGFIIDLWGVVHDGVAPYAGAVDCLKQLTGRPVLLLSNAPRRVGPSGDALRKLGVDDTLYTNLLTSGEATWLALRDRPDAWLQALGHHVYHLGPDRDRSVIEGLNLDLVQTPGAASFILNTGPDDLRDGCSLDEFKPELQACLDAGLKMICANPDLEVVRGGKRILCAGALAEFYEAAGGDVRWIGKPDGAIYDQAMEIMGLPRTRLLAIGDSLRTDIAGAARSGMDSVWVLGGIHASDFAGDPAASERAALRAGVSPVATLDAFTW